MDRLNVSGGSPVRAGYWSHNGYGAVTLGDPPEHTSGKSFFALSLSRRSRRDSPRTLRAWLGRVSRPREKLHGGPYMRKKIDPVVDEAIETLNMKDGPSRRRLLEGAGLFSATAAASALIAACSSSSSSSAAPNGTAAAVAGNFPSTPKWKFTFVNHVTDNTFFTATQY